MKKGIKFYISLVLFLFSIVAVSFMIWFLNSKEWDTMQIATIYFMMIAYAFFGFILLKFNLLNRNAQ